MKIISESPERLVLGKRNIAGGLACLAMTPLVAFLGVMMILDEPPALGWALIALAVLMVGLAVVAMKSQVRLVLDRDDDIVRLSHIKPWRRRHDERALSSITDVTVETMSHDGTDVTRVLVKPDADSLQPSLMVGAFVQDGKARAYAATIRRWMAGDAPEN